MIETFSRKVATLSGAALLAAGAVLTPLGASADNHGGSEMPGKAIAFDRGKGNCLACHHIEGGQSPGNIGPPLVAMKARYPERAKLHAQIYDATTINPESAMPPFGKHYVLSPEELDLVVDYVWTL